MEVKDLLCGNLEAFGARGDVSRQSDLSSLRVFLNISKENNGEFTPKALKKLEALRIKLLDLKRIDIIKGVDSPRFGSPVFMVPKSNKRCRMVVNLTIFTDASNKHFSIVLVQRNLRNNDSIYHYDQS